MKAAILLGAFVLHIVTSLTPAQQPATVAIYLFANPVDARTVKQDQWKSLPLASEPIISETDILAYDFSKHAIKLSAEALKRLPRPPVTGTPFVVVINGERIYPGAFYNMASSIPCDMPVIVTARIGQSESLGADVVLIDRAYPQQYATGKDLRSDARIRDALGKLKKLAAL